VQVRLPGTTNEFEPLVDLLDTDEHAPHEVTTSIQPPPNSCTNQTSASGLDGSATSST